MKVSVKDFTVQLDIKNNGVELQVYANDDTFLGDCIITKTKLIWCQGKTKRANGKKIIWDDFIKMMNKR